MYKKYKLFLEDNMNTITFTKEQALKFTNQNNSTRPIRIKNALEKMGF